MDPFLQSHRLQRFLCPLPALFQRNIGIQKGQRHIVHSLHFGHQIKTLKHEADVLIAHICQIIVLQIAQIVAVKLILPGSGHIQTANDVHQRAFPGTGGAHNGNIVPLLHFQMDVLQHPHGLLPLHIVLADVGKL